MSTQETGVGLSVGNELAQPLVRDALALTEQDAVLLGAFIKPEVIIIKFDNYLSRERVDNSATAALMREIHWSEDKQSQAKKALSEIPYETNGSNWSLRGPLIVHDDSESLTIIENPVAAKFGASFLKNNSAIRYHTSEHQKTNEDNIVRAGRRVGRLVAKVASGGGGATAGYNVLALFAQQPMLISAIGSVVMGGLSYAGASLAVRHRQNVRSDHAFDVLLNKLKATNPVSETAVATELLRIEIPSMGSGRIGVEFDHYEGGTIDSVLHSAGMVRQLDLSDSFERSYRRAWGGEPLREAKSSGKDGFSIIPAKLIKDIIVGVPDVELSWNTYLRDTAMRYSRLLAQLQVLNRIIALDTENTMPEKIEERRLLHKDLETMTVHFLRVAAKDCKGELKPDEVNILGDSGAANRLELAAEYVRAIEEEPAAVEGDCAEQIIQTTRGFQAALLEICGGLTDSNQLGDEIILVSILKRAYVDLQQKMSREIRNPDAITLLARSAYKALYQAINPGKEPKYLPDTATWESFERKYIYAEPSTEMLKITSWQNLPATPK